MCYDFFEVIYLYENLFYFIFPIYHTSNIFDFCNVFYTLKPKKLATNINIYIFFSKKNERLALKDAKNMFRKSLRKNLKSGCNHPYSFFFKFDSKISTEPINLFNKNDFKKIYEDCVNLVGLSKNHKKYRAQYSYSNVNEKSKFKKQDIVAYHKKTSIKLATKPFVASGSDDPNENNNIKKDLLSGGIYSLKLKQLLNSKKIHEKIKTDKDTRDNSNFSNTRFNFIEHGNSGLNRNAGDS
jgi:hypothetical protein